MSSSLREQLQSIYDEHQLLTPELVVNVARPKDHPLHNRFEWDNTIAGERFREIQARQLIVSVKVSYATDTAEDEANEDRVRAFHIMPRGAGTSYVPIEEVAQDEFSKQLLLKQAERDWQALQRRYSHLAEFLEMVRIDVAQ